MISPTLYDVSAERAYLRLGRGKASRLPVTGQRVLKALANWRERRAQDKDLPRSWVARDDVLYALAEHCPQNQDQLQEAISDQNKFIKRYGVELIEVIKTQLTELSSEQVWTQPQRMEPAEVKQVKHLMKRLDELSEKLGVAKTMLSTKRDIEQLVLGNTSTRLFRGWREETVGKPLAEILRLSAG